MRCIDHTGQRFGKLTVLCKAETVKGHAKWKCKCDCGNEVIVDAGNLRSGHSQSCGYCAKYSFVDPNTVRCDFPSGLFFLIDAEDYPVVSKYKWNFEDSGYVQAKVEGKHVRLHSYLIGKAGYVVDHINCLRYDNRRSNLRICSNKENVRNQRISIRNTSGYKGVSFDRRRGKYSACITVDGKGHFLGYFSEPAEAARAYDFAAIRFFGEYARPNFKEGSMYEKVLELDQKRGHGAA